MAKPITTRPRNADGAFGAVQQHFEQLPNNTADVAVPAVTAQMSQLMLLVMALQQQVAGLQAELKGGETVD